MLPANAETWEMWVLSLDWEDPLERIFWSREATHSSVLAWRLSWTEEPGGLQFMELQRDMTEHTHTLTHTHTHVHSACLVDPLHLYQPFSKVNVLVIP